MDQPLQYKPSPIKNIVNVSLLFVVMLIYSKFFNFGFWEMSVGPKVMYAMAFIMLLLCFIGAKQVPNSYKFKRLVIIMCGVLIVSGLLAIPDIGARAIKTPLLMAIGLLSYFSFKFLKVTVNQLIISFTIFGLITFAIQYWQINMDFPIFGLDYENDAGEVGERNDIARYMVGSYCVAMFLICYYWAKFITRPNIFALSLFMIFVASLYLYLTRQLYVSIAVTLVLSILFMPSRKMQFFSVVMLLISAFILITFSKQIFGDMFESSEGSTDIRLQCMKYISGELQLNPAYLITGKGHGPYEQALAAKDFYLSDIGILGEMFYYGIFWVILYFVAIYKLLITYRKKTPIFITLFLIAAAVPSPFIFPYRVIFECFIWACVFYIADLSIAAKEEEEDEEEDKEDDDEERLEEIPDTQSKSTDHATA